MIGSGAARTKVLQLSVTTHEEASKQHLLFKFCYKNDNLNIHTFSYQKLIAIIGFQTHYK